MKEVKVPYIFYYYLHSKIWKMANGSLVSEKDVKKYMFQWKIPKKIKPIILKELIMLGLIKKDKQYLLKINKPEFKEEDINDYYYKVGLF